MDLASPAESTLRQPLPELAYVKLLCPLDDWDGQNLAAGTKGTIVSVMEPGVAYLVETYDGAYHLIDVRAEDLALVDDAD